MVQYGRKKKIMLMAASLTALIVILAVFLNTTQSTGEVVITSVSTDAHYAITTDSKNDAVLWDLQKHTKTILSHDANMYSAYWIKHTPYFLWQSLKDKIVHVTSVSNQKDIMQLHPKKLVYGEALSQNLKNYIMSDVNWNIYLFQNEQSFQLARNYTSGTFEGVNKIINFTFIDNNHVLSSGMAYPTGDMQWGPTLWNLNDRKPSLNYIGNMVQTFATISPDGKYIVAGDIDALQYVWELRTGKKLIQLIAAQPILKETKSGVITDKNTIKQPHDFYNNNNILAVKYIDQNHYVVFTNSSHYAILYQTLNPKPIKYLDLGSKPLLATFNLERDQSMDTSPSAHILVMAKDQQPGIIVYQYDPKTQTIKKTWDAD